MTKAIKYACDDGFAVRMRGYEAWACYADNEWREIDAVDACCKCGVLTEQEYHEWFGDLPPLPDTAFCDGWYGPLL